MRCVLLQSIIMSRVSRVRVLLPNSLCVGIAIELHWNHGPCKALMGADNYYLRCRPNAAVSLGDYFTSGLPRRRRCRCKCMKRSPTHMHGIFGGWPFNTGDVGRAPTQKTGDAVNMFVRLLLSAPCCCPVNSKVESDLVSPRKTRTSLL